MAGTVLVAVAGSEPDAFWTALDGLLPPGADVELFHVIDEGPRRELDLQFLRRPGHPRPPDLDERTLDAERRGSAAILAEGRTRLAREAATSEARGRPEQEIVSRAAAMDAALVVVGARSHSGSAVSGPASVGHVARFVVDHAPCPVLIVRFGR